MDPLEFDLDRYLRNSKRIDLDGIAWHEIADHPVTAEEVRCLTYMMDIESHTAIFLRDLLATKAAREADITAFLSCWAYEELWHGEALSRFLGEAKAVTLPDRETPGSAAAYPSRVARNTWIRTSLAGKGTASHLATMLGSWAMKDFAALHMTWGAVNELSTLKGYAALRDRTSHPVLRELLDRIIKDERRHFAFYRAQARLRLGRSAAARRMTRWALEHLWAPVGTGVRPQLETDFVVRHLLGDRAGAVTAEDMDTVIGRLPGLHGLRIVSRARRAALAA